MGQLWFCTNFVTMHKGLCHCWPLAAAFLLLGAKLEAAKSSQNENSKSPTGWAHCRDLKCVTVTSFDLCTGECRKADGCTGINFQPTKQSCCLLLCTKPNGTYQGLSDMSNVIQGAIDIDFFEVLTLTIDIELAILESLKLPLTFNLGNDCMQLLTLRSELLTLL